MKVMSVRMSCGIAQLPEAIAILVQMMKTAGGLNRVLPDLRRSDGHQRLIGLRCILF